LSNLDSAVEVGAETAARAGVAEAPGEFDLAVEKDDLQEQQLGLSGHLHRQAKQ
jgi:hypothetical protein